MTPIETQPATDPKPDATTSQLVALALTLAMLAETQAAIIDVIEGLQRQLANLTAKPAEA